MLTWTTERFSSLAYLSSAAERLYNCSHRKRGTFGFFQQQTIASEESGQSHVLAPKDTHVNTTNASAPPRVNQHLLSVTSTTIHDAVLSRHVCPAVIRFEVWIFPFYVFMHWCMHGPPTGSIRIRPSQGPTNWFFDLILLLLNLEKSKQPHFFCKFQIINKSYICPPQPLCKNTCTLYCWDCCVKTVTFGSVVFYRRLFSTSETPTLWG